MLRIVKLSRSYCKGDPKDYTIYLLIDSLASKGLLTLLWFTRDNIATSVLNTYLIDLSNYRFIKLSILINYRNFDYRYFDYIWRFDNRSIENRSIVNRRTRDNIGTRTTVDKQAGKLN